MTEHPIAITSINQFIFCPASIYFHMIDAEAAEIMSKSTYQINGAAAHATIDSGTYTSRLSVLQGIFVFSEKYNLFGKIDVFDSSTGLLSERKKKITTIYDGYVFQLYAQYFGLQEMGYTVKSMRLHSMDDNKNYPIELPENNLNMLLKFEDTLLEYRNFDLNNFQPSDISRCNNCVDRNICAFSLDVGEI